MESVLVWEVLSYPSLIQGRRLSSVAIGSRGEVEVKTIGFKSSCCTSLNQALLGIVAGRSFRIGDVTSLARLSYLWFNSVRVSVSGSWSLYSSSLEASFSASSLCPRSRLSAAVCGSHTALRSRFRSFWAAAYSVMLVSSCCLCPAEFQ